MVGEEAALNHLLHRSNAMKKAILVFGLLLVVMITVVDARQFRSMQPIATPANKGETELPEGARVVEKIQPLTVKQVEAAVEKLLSSWNTSELGEHLGDDFFDSSRLLDAINTVAPRDAKLRLQSVQSVQTLQQYIEPNPNKHGQEQLVSKVSVTARTQLEFQAADGGFQRRVGTNEYILKITFPEQGGQLQ